MIREDHTDGFYAEIHHENILEETRAKFQDLHRYGGPAEYIDGRTMALVYGFEFYVRTTDPVIATSVESLGDYLNNASPGTESEFSRGYYDQSQLLLESLRRELGLPSL